MKTLVQTAFFGLAFCLFHSLEAQRLWAAVGYTADGQPTEPSQEWDIAPDAGGAAIYLVYRAEGARDAEPNSLFVRHRPLRSNSGEFVAFDEVYNWAAGGDGWRVYDYTFKEEGVFELSVKNQEGRIVASTTVMLSPPGDRTPVEPPQNEPKAALARADLGRIRMATCTGVSGEGDPTGIGTEFGVPGEGGQLFSIVQCERPFGAWRIEFELWKLDDFGFETFVDMVAYDVRPEWNWFKTPFVFRDAGRYKFKFFVGDGERRPVSEAIFRVQIR